MYYTLNHKKEACVGFHAPKVLPHTCIYGQTPPTLLRRRSVYCLVYALFESGSFSEQMTIAKRYVNSNVCTRFPDYNANIAQANEIMQIYLQLFYNERSLYSVLLNSSSKCNNANSFKIIFK